jgi:hypothetical protein
VESRPGLRIALEFSHANHRQSGAFAALCLTCIALPGISLAGPSDYAFSPIVEEGERGIDFKAASRIRVLKMADL